MTKVIQSKDNRIFKACQKLQQKKYRDREGLYFIEGPNLIGEAPAADIEYIVISEERQSDYGEYLSGEQPVYLMAEHLFRRIAQTETSQGLSLIHIYVWAFWFSTSSPPNCSWAIRVPWPWAELSLRRPSS